jgi:hypothetical protein
MVLMELMPITYALILSDIVKKPEVHQ